MQRTVAPGQFQNLHTLDVVTARELKVCEGCGVSFIRAKPVDVKHGEKMCKKCHSNPDPAAPKEKVDWRNVH